MASPCEYCMYFPAAPISRLSDAAQYASLPLRKHVYVGETVQVLLVLRPQGSDGSAAPPWKGPPGSLCAVASVCGDEERSSGRDVELRSSDSEDQEEEAEEEDEEDEEEEEEEEEEEDSPGAEKRPRATGHSEPKFRACSPLLSQHSPAEGELLQRGESVLLLEDQVVLCLTVSLDKLPADTRKAKVVVTVWRQEEDRGQMVEYGYLTLLQLKSPTHTFQQDGSTFKTQVSTTLEVLPPPSLQCQQLSVSGKYLTVLKVLNCGSQEKMFIRDVKILPNYNSSYLPMMPDGSVLIVDNVCHQSAEVTTASFCRLNTRCSRLPSMLRALEEQNFLFQLQLQDKVEEDSGEGLEMKLLAVLQWYTPTLTFTRYISTCYLLPSICLDRPRLVMTASCPRMVRPLETFWVKYTLMNDLQDFLAVRLIWNSEEGEEEPAVVCRSPLTNLGRCRKGSALSITVTFQILQTGLFELSKHMKMKLQMTASVSTAPSSSPTVGSSHPQSPEWHRSRSGSRMEDGESVLCEHTSVPRGKIAKRECKVLVLEPVRETLGR
ncbi:unnamed protein product [Ophioblennius macclurei]